MSHQSVELFKQFVRKHPGLIKEVRNGKKNWKELYEEWYILGEKDEVWEPYKKNNKKETDKNTENEWLPNLLSKIKEVDLNHVQENIQQMNGLVDSVQQLVRDFRPKPPSPHYPQRPFYYR